VLGNVPASGTEIIAELGVEHLRTGRPIVYTSGDSVFQIATHTDVVSLQQLYEWCRIARRLLVGEHNVGRVIARPFAGAPGAFVRRPERRDFSVPPPGPTLLDRCVEHGVAVYGIGKIRDIFAQQGITEGVYSDSNDHGVDLTLRYLARPGPALVFTNLVDFDSKYGHRNDPEGYAHAIEALDRRVPELIGALDGGALLLTGDHGCDPTTPSTDHSRERTPVLVAGVPGGPHDVGDRATFADLGATAAALLGVPWDLAGESFAAEVGW
jgi:phosphopentomutase